MLKSLALKPGDRVGIVCTARWIEPEVLESGMQTLRSWGYVPVAGATTRLRWNQFAGTDDERRADLQHMLDDASVRAIVIGRGGYGTIRIMEGLDFSKFMEAPKFICGFSDISVLHIHINDKLGIPSIHSPMPVNFISATPASLHTFRTLLEGSTPDTYLSPHALNVNGKASGIITGGNLSILYALLGTRYGFGAANKILFIEDLDEYLYHIDRMMMSLELAGKLSAVKGIIVGAFSNMKDNTVPFGFSAEEIIRQSVRKYNIPLAFGFPAGHIDDNHAILFGRNATLEVTDAGAALHYTT